MMRGIIHIEPSTFERIGKNPTSVQQEVLFFHTFDLFRIRYPVPGKCPNKLRSECNTNLESDLPRIYEGPNYQCCHMSALTLECISNIEMGLIFFEPSGQNLL